jgi:hypothetical protein
MHVIVLKVSGFAFDSAKNENTPHGHVILQRATNVTTSVLDLLVWMRSRLS